jgi:hypothetical protein
MRCGINEIRSYECTVRAERTGDGGLPSDHIVQLGSCMKVNTDELQRSRRRSNRLRRFKQLGSIHAEF